MPLGPRLVQLQSVRSCPPCRAELRCQLSSRSGRLPPVPLPTLFQLMASHRCEAARWALDAKAQPYLVRSLLPGPHLAQLAALTRQTQVPALELGGRIFVGTAKIAEALDATARDGFALLPAQGAARAGALATVAALEAALLDPLETLWLAAVLSDPEYAAALFALGRGPTRRRVYHAIFPGVRAGLTTRFRLNDPRHVAAQRDRALAGLDHMAAAIHAGAVSTDAVDLTLIAAASLVSWFVPLPWCPYRLQDHAPAALQALIADLRPHPAVVWAARAYERHRGVSMAENHEIEGSGVI